MKKNTKETKEKKNNMAIAIIFGTLIVIAGIVVIFFNIRSSVPINADSKSENFGSIEELGELEDIRTRLKFLYQPDRSVYGQGYYKDAKGNAKSFDIIDAFRELPDMPSDMWYAKYLVVNKKLESKSICNFGKNYYLQPEFYTSTFYKDAGVTQKNVLNCSLFFNETTEQEENICKNETISVPKILGGINFWKNPYMANTDGGFGNYPADQVHLVEPGKNYRFCSFFKAGFGVENYQVLGLKKMRPKMSIEVEGQNLVANNSFDIPFNLSKYEIVLAPTFPIFKVNEDGWATQIDLFVNVPADIPLGFYSVGFDVGKGSAEMLDEMRLKYTYGKVTGKGMWGVGRPQLRLGLLVE